MNNTICFVVALKSEAQPFLEKIHNLESSFICDKPLFSGEFCGKKIKLAISGIGKVSASLTAQLMIDKFSPDYLINFGTSGGFKESTNVFSYYYVNRACQSDFDITAIDNVEVGYIQEYDRIYFENFVPNNNLQVATLATADKFSNEDNFIALVKKMGAGLRDMEGCAISQVCTSNKITCIMIKGVTDIYGNPASDYHANFVKVVSYFPTILENLIKGL